MRLVAEGVAADSWIREMSKSVNSESWHRVVSGACARSFQLRCANRDRNRSRQANRMYTGEWSGSRGQIHRIDSRSARWIGRSVRTGSGARSDMILPRSLRIALFVTSGRIRGWNFGYPLSGGTDPVRGSSRPPMQSRNVPVQEEWAHGCEILQFRGGVSTGG